MIKMYPGLLAKRRNPGNTSLHCHKYGCIIDSIIKPTNTLRALSLEVDSTAQGRLCVKLNISLPSLAE
jgi:hypothetical protein